MSDERLLSQQRTKRIKSVGSTVVEQDTQGIFIAPRLPRLLRNTSQWFLPAAKRRREDNHDNNTEALLDAQQAEVALQAAERTRLQKAKKKKRESFQQHYPPLSMLPAELLTQIFLYLSDVRTIHALSKYAKFVRKAATPEVVIRAAVFGGASPRQVLGHAMSLVGTGAIHVPTPFRLLRFVLAKRCERCSDCFGYDLVTKKPRKLGLDRPYGLAICDASASCLGATLGRHNHKINNLPFLSTKNWTFSLLTHPVTERGTGLPRGTVAHVLQSEASHWFVRTRQGGASLARNVRRFCKDPRV